MTDHAGWHNDVRLTVAAAEAGTRVDRVLANACPALSRSHIQRLIRNGHLTADGANLADPSAPVKANTRLHLQLPPPSETTPGAQSAPVPIIYEDAQLVVVDKPAGMVVHPAAGSPDHTLVNALIAHCGGGFIGTGPNQRRGIVHRLDKDTSGLLVAAKTEPAETALIEQFQAHSVARQYLGMVWGCPAPTRGTLTGPIGRSPANRKKMAVLAQGGRPAVTHYTVRETLCAGALSVVECRLETGRTHQIRVHMAHAGHPVLADPVYGRGGRRARKRLHADARALVDGMPRQALHAAELGFRHPAHGTWLRFTSTPPADMTAVIRDLGGCLENLD
jgi:23S rRNA pseudouridine1911/1915/1917 synthase